MKNVFSYVKAAIAGVGLTVNEGKIDRVTHSDTHTRESCVDHISYCNQTSKVYYGNKQNVKWAFNEFEWVKSKIPKDLCYS